MAEFWDVYDKDKNKLGKISKRGDPLGDDEFHLVINAWIKNNENKFLITQRVPNKPHPLMWECTGGSAVCGEDSLTAAIREAKEETGIDLTNEQRKFIGSKNRYYKSLQDILDVWIFKYTGSNDNVKIQEEEVNDYKWASIDEIIELDKQGKFKKNAYFEEVISGKINI